MRRLQFFTAVIFFLSITNLFGQATWNKVGSGLDQRSFAEIDAHKYNNEIYVAEFTYPASNPPPVVRIKKWNGLSWTSSPFYSISSYVSFGDMEVYKGDVYIGLRDTSSGNNTLIKFDGSNWNKVSLFTNTGNPKRINTLETYNGNLYIGGVFNFSSGGKTYRNIAKYDGNNYTPINGLGTFQIKDILVHNNSLYCLGVDLSTITHQLYKRNTSGWNSPSYFTQGTSSANFEADKLCSYNNTIYGANKKGDVYEFKKDTAFYIAGFNFGISDMDTLNNKLFIVGDANRSGFGGGGLRQYDGQSFVTVNAPSRLRSGLSYQNELYYFARIPTRYKGLKYNRAYRSDLNFSLLKGEVYNDQNADCFKNSNEQFLENIMLKLGAVNAISDSNGVYTMALPTGTYSVDSVKPMQQRLKNLKVQCSLPTQITVGSGQNITQDIPLQNTISTDAGILCTGVLGWRARQGFTESYELQFTNFGNSTLPSATGQLNLPPSVSFVSSTPPPNSVNGNMLTYDFLNVSPMSSEKVDLKIKIDTTTTNIGDTITFTSNISGVNGDADLTDNQDTLKQEITAAIDPNDKQASATRITPSVDQVDYHIRFQNTGNDTAVKVTVVDTLDMSLPLTKIVINSASHPYQLSVKNNILVWQFNDIMLPDSATDPTGSEGYVRFSAGLNPALGIGDTIDNDAEIYFDYQPPVHTNHAKTVIVENISLPENKKSAALLDVYPNPGSERIKIDNTSKKSLKLQLIDATGKKLDEISVDAQEGLTYPVADLKPGLYFLSGLEATYKLVIKR